MSPDNRDKIIQARKDGFITRTRANTVLDSSADRDAKTIDSGTQIISFDQQYAYFWSLLENDTRCKLMDRRRYGKVCKWTDKVKKG